MERGKWERQRPDGMHGWVMDHQSLDLSRSTSSLVTKNKFQVASRLVSSAFLDESAIVLLWVENGCPAQLSRSPGLCAYPCLWLWEGLQWLETFVVWSASAILLLGEKTRHIMWFWIVPRLWHYQGCYLKDIACRNKVEVIPEGGMRIGVGHKDVFSIQWFGSKTPLTFTWQSFMICNVMF